MMMISFVVPAHNEQRLIGATLESVQRAAQEVGVRSERIVVDDGSTDSTAAIARRAGARVVRIHARKIAAARNAGAAEARGSLLIFVDADTRLTAAALREILAASANGAVGGGPDIRYDEQTPRHLHPVVWLVRVVMRANGWAFGCCLFARADAFAAVGGFDERSLAGEEIDLSRALARRGRFVLLRERVVTSSRKARLYTPWQHVRQLLWLALVGRRRRASRQRLFLWYDGRREG